MTRVASRLREPPHLPTENEPPPSRLAETPALSRNGAFILGGVVGRIAPGSNHAYRTCTEGARRGKKNLRQGVGGGGARDSGRRSGRLRSRNLDCCSGHCIFLLHVLEASTARYPARVCVARAGSMRTKGTVPHGSARERHTEVAAVKDGSPWLRHLGAAR